MKEMTLTWRWKKEWELFLDFLKKTRWMILFASGILLLAYGQWLKTPELHLDPDILIADPTSQFGEGHVGRQGITLVHTLLGLRKFNPGFMNACGWLALCAAGVVVGYALYRCGLRAPCACAALAPLMFISTTTANQFYWYQRLISFAVAYALCGVAAALSWYGLIKKKWLPCLLSVPLLIWVLSIYQSMLFVYVAVAITAYLMLYRRLALTEGRESIPRFSAVVGQVFLFAAVYLLNTFITNTFFADRAELKTLQRLLTSWGRQPTSQCVRNILAYVKRGLLGGLTYSTWIYGALSVLVILAVFWECWNAKGKKGRWLYVLAALALQTCPFLMAVYCGGEPQCHIQLAYPAVMACNILFLAGLRLPRMQGLSRLVAVILAVVLMWGQGGMVMRALYTDSVRVAEDRYTMEEIAAQIHQVNGKNKPVAFIGYHTDNLNPACLRVEYIPESVLGWDHSAAPHYSAGSRRTAQFFQTIGIDITGLTDEAAVLNARRAALDMPVWPALGSVKETENCVIVKLSEDEWPEEIVQPSLTSVETLGLPYSGAVRAAVESATVEDGRLTVRGTVYQDNARHSLWKPHLYLLRGESGEVFELETVKYGRPERIVGGRPDPDSGFVAMAPADEVAALGDYTVLFGYEDTTSGQIVLCDTSISLGTALGGHAAGLPGTDQTEKTDRPGDIGFSHTNARLEGNELVSDEGANGCILWGPYSESIPGVYDITLNYTVESTADSSEGTGTFDVALDAQQYAAVSIPADQTSVTLEDVSIEAGHKFEARVMIPAGMVIRVQSIHYARVG